MRIPRHSCTQLDYAADVGFNNLRKYIRVR